VPTVAKCQNQNEENKPRLLVQTGHSREVNSVALSPDGKILASGSLDYIVKLWDVQSGKELRALSGNPSPVNVVYSVAFSPNGSLLAAGYWDKTIKLWDVQSGKEIRTLIGHTSEVWAIAFSPDGKTLASGSWDKTIKLWDVQSGKEQQTFSGHKAEIYSIAFSPDGKVLASGSDDKTIKLWDIHSAQELKTFSGITGEIKSLAFSPDGKVLVSGGNDKTISLWDVATGKKLKTLSGHAYSINSIAFSPDGNILASAGSYKTIKLWDATTGAELRSLNVGNASVKSIVFSSDGKTLISACGNTIKFWNVQTEKELKTFSGHSFDIWATAFSPDGEVLAIGSDDKTVKLWDSQTGKKLKILSGHSSHVWLLAFSPNGKLLASLAGDLDKTVKLWDVETGKELRTFSESTCFAFSPDGKMLAVGSQDKSIKLLHLQTQKELKISTGYKSEIRRVVFSPDSKMLVSGGFAKVSLWDVQTGGELRSFTGITTQVWTVEISPDGKMLAAGCDDHVIKLWNLQTGVELQSLEGHTGAVWQVAFSPDSKTLASRSGNSLIKMWNVVTGKERNSFDLNNSSTTRQVHAIVPALYHNSAYEPVTPDNKYQIKIEDGKLNLYDIQSEALLVSLIALDRDDWAVVDSAGRFETNKDLGNKIEGLHWILPEDSFMPLPLELFMREYYEPNLLQRAFNDEKFSKVRDLSKLNLAQPKVEITGISLPDTNNVVTILVKVENGERDVIREGKKIKQISGVYDLHVFRDQCLVQIAPSESVTDLARIPPDFNLEQEIPLWRTATRILASEDKSPKTLSFKVKLPKGRDASKVEFTAYAFNEDRIKSDTAKGEWSSEQISVLPKAQSIKPKVYLISVGINETGNPKWTLNYANKDARELQKVLGDKLEAQQRFDIVRIALISEKINNTFSYQASKENIKAIFDLLAGRNVKRSILASIPAFKKLQLSTPDDVIIMTFASHGYTDDNGRFYLVPSGIRYSNGGIVESSLISSEDISFWMKDVEASNMFMIFDSCYSANFTGKDFKPGPMGSRGLGQLAYNKKIRILTAAREKAYETSDLKMSVLSYVLLKKGIEEREANFNPADDNTITFQEWMEYAAKEVPIFYKDPNSVGIPQQTLQSKEKDFLQKPYLFDFVRDGTDLEIIKMLNK
jgi:WD40 repeat protein